MSMTTLYDPSRTAGRSAALVAGLLVMVAAAAGFVGAAPSRSAGSDLAPPGWAKGGSPSNPQSQVAADEKRARAECAENTLLLFRVRGSDERPGEDKLGAWTFAAGEAAIAKGWRVRDMQADYPAPSLPLSQIGVDVAVAVVRKNPLALASAVKRLKDFRDVASRSWPAVRDQIVAAYNRCQKRTILLASYSYGGIVLRYVVRNLPPEVRDRTARIDLVADPTAQGSIDREMIHAGGLDARSTPQGIDTWAARTTNPFFKQSRYPDGVVRGTAQYCVPYDLVCEANAVNFAAFAGQSKRHTSYKWAAIGRQAAELLRPRRGKAAGSTEPKDVRLPDCGSSTYGGSAAPRTWDRGCTGSADLVAMRWRDWGSTEAVATGRTTMRDCIPNCADGKTYSFPVRAWVSRIRRCRDDQGRIAWFYTRIRMRFRIPAPAPPGLQPGLRDSTWSLHCVQP